MATQYDYIFQVRGHLLREVKTGKLYPFRAREITAGSTISPGVNKRFFVKSVYISYASLVTDAGTTLSVTAPVNFETNNLAQIVKTTLVVNHDTKEFNPCLLIDREKSITFTAADITTKSCVVIVAEVDDSA